ncbi:MAG TPA: MGMT family protein [Candidatus Omnitrophota bacterium]|nr:MGMT family protein [Candidatus Omnitrophota bacterium]
MTRSSALKKAIRRNNDLTSFQKKVLLGALEIPRGEVRTYAWIAAKAGSPGAARAAGSALSRNPYAPLVPCHRVIASDGSIGGYSGGTEKKKKLLAQEGALKRIRKNDAG